MNMKKPQRNKFNMDPFWLIARAVVIGKEIMEMIEADRDKKGVLVEVGIKIESVNSILDKINKNRDDADELKRQIEEIKVLLSQPYVRDDGDELKRQMEEIKVLLSHANRLTQEINDLKKLLSQPDVTDDAEEQAQAEQLQDQVRTKRILPQQLQQFGLGNRAEVKLAVEQAEAEAERQRLLKDTADTKNDDHLDIVIRLLKEIEAGVPDDEVPEVEPPKAPSSGIKWPECPPSHQPMEDPVLLDCERCRPTVSKRSFEEWRRVEETSPTSGGPPTCPFCRARLKSLKVTPNRALIQTLEENSPQARTHQVSDERSEDQRTSVPKPEQDGMNPSKETKTDLVVSTLYI